MNDPILRSLTRRQALWLGYILAPFFVAATTYGLMGVVTSLKAMEHLQYVRPYGAGYVFPVLIACVIGGRGPGLFALLLGEAALAFILKQLHQPHLALTPRDWVELTVLPLVSAVVLMGIQALRQNIVLLTLSEAAQARSSVMASSAPIGIAVVGSRGDIQFANREVERIFGEELTGKTADKLTSRSWRAAGDELVLATECPLGRVQRGFVISDAQELYTELPGGERIWTEHRATMVQDAAYRSLGALLIVTDITERKLTEIGLRARAKRDSVIERVSAALRSDSPPESIKETAAAALGEALEVDRCCFVTVEHSGELAVSVSGDYHRDGHLPEAVEMPSDSSEQDTELQEFLRSRQSLQIDDLQAARDAGQEIAWAQRLNCGSGTIRSLMAVPIFDNDAAVALLVAATTRPRAWSDDDLALAEIVAAQTRSATESARLRLKEHRIATILQEALRPPVPATMPSLELASYYRAALEEASIGGDFLDVFTVEAGLRNHRTAILIGDVSGKGLAAATQVATVRMMLRYAITRGDDMAQTLEHLNDTLASRDWLIGFATLFVGIYDPRTGFLQYVSCGHEPMLLRRASSGVIDYLASTGGAMGAYEGALYESKMVCLEQGDELLLYTDGVSDIGPSRSDALGTSGVARLFTEAPTGSGAVGIVRYLCAEVDKYSRGVQQDDVCMLAVVVTQAEAAGSMRSAVELIAPQPAIPG